MAWCMPSVRVISLGLGTRLGGGVLHTIGRRKRKKCVCVCVCACMCMRRCTSYYWQEEAKEVCVCAHVRERERERERESMCVCMCVRRWGVKEKRLYNVFSNVIRSVLSSLRHSSSQGAERPSQVEDEYHNT